jgi:hypothetical protein
MVKGVPPLFRTLNAALGSIDATRRQSGESDLVGSRTSVANLIGTNINKRNSMSIEARANPRERRYEFTVNLSQRFKFET